MLLSTFGVGAMLLAASVAAQDSSSGDAVMVLPVDTPAEPPLPETEDDQVGPKDSKKNNDDKKDDAKVTNRVATAQVTGEVNGQLSFLAVL